jgi:sugar phosphate isomerase/epimerase
MKPSITIYGGPKMLFGEDNFSVCTAIKRVAELGFEGIDLGYYWENGKNEMADAVKAAKDSNIAISGYIVGNNFGNACQQGKEQEEIDKVKKALDEAAIVGAKTLRVFAGGYNLSWEEYSSKILSCFEQCIDQARNNNVVMALEDHGALCKDSKEMLYYIESIHSPFLRAAVDIGNFGFHGDEEPKTGVRNTAKYAAMVHVKDYAKIDNKLICVPVGDGDIDFPVCFKILQEAGYDNWLSLEYECTDVNPLKGIMDSLNHIKYCLMRLKNKPE